MSTVTRIIEHDIETIVESFEEAEDQANAARRKSLFIKLGLGVGALALAYGAYDMFFASAHVTTDNAYVGADVAQVTPLVGGPVAQVLVQDTQAVKRGDVLVRLDDTDARIALAKAEADRHRRRA